MADAPQCLIDTNAFVHIRKLVRDNPSLTRQQVIGADDVVISETVYDELMVDLPPEDYKVRLNDDTLTWLGGRMVQVTDADGDQADFINRFYARHHPPPNDVNDALIAATTMRLGRVLLTRNVRHFHYILGLRYVSVNPWPMALPILATRPVEAGNHSKACCQPLRPKPSTSR